MGIYLKVNIALPSTTRTLEDGVHIAQCIQNLHPWPHCCHSSVDRLVVPVPRASYDSCWAGVEHILILDFGLYPSVRLLPGAS